MTVAIRAENLVKEYKGGVRALDGLSLEVEAGTVFGLLGPNGSGKTTTVRILTTVAAPDTGSASVLGFDVVREPEEVRTRIGLAGQFAAVDENLSGLENLRMIGQLNQLTRASAKLRANELLEVFELTGAAKRSVKTYSGGMRRRLDLAAALVNSPPVLFLDEPTTGLDPYSRQSLWQVIEDLVARGTTVLLTTQYLEEADRLAKNIAVMDHGRMIAQGTPAQLKAGLGASVVELEMKNAADAHLVGEAIRSRGNGSIRVEDTKVEIPLEGGPTQLRWIFDVMSEVSCEPHGFSLREPSLDDVFLTLTGHQAEEGSMG